MEKSTGRAQLWLRGDAVSASGAPAIVVFDNMQDRPIRSTTWNYFEIVAKVPANTKSLVLGVLFLGKGTMWVDDCTLQVIEEGSSTLTTTKSSSSLLAMSQSNTRPEEPIWLVACGVGLALLGLALSVWAHRAPNVPIQPFALRFACWYWVLYSQASILHILPYLGTSVVGVLSATQDTSVRWFAKSILRIDHELIGPNGSGDTTHDYIRLLMLMLVSLLVGAIWTLLPRRTEWDERIKDIFQSFLRYTLALAMLGYGLAKMTTTGNQFPPPQVEQLLQTWGDSSPMNVVWTMMGSSPTYTFFGGAAEVTAALLLIWRRTAWFGAAISIGVMLNIFLLNICFDIPVKQYSFHLLAIGISLLFSDLRWIQLLLLNRPTPSRDLGPSYKPQFFGWVHMGIKAVILLLGFIVPILSTAGQEILARVSRSNAQPFTGTTSTNQVVGAYRVEEFELAGNASNEEKAGKKWRNVILRETPSFGERAGFTLMQIYYASSQVGTEDGSSKEVFRVTHDSSSSTIADASDHSELRYVLSGDKVVLKGTWKNQQVQAVLKRISRDDFLLIHRGFRWVNEFPFNR
jgi:uncharacterized membrane protein YphA (DoxX/SURF4 family)